MKSQDNHLSLQVIYGYRTLEIQTKRFLKRLSKMSNTTFYNNPYDLYEVSHKTVAVPIVAGHPTGGAVDMVLIDKNKRIVDADSYPYDYTTNRYNTFHPDISTNAKRTRLILRNAMMEAGFAPFDGEWWHFSYGDREWAFYYGKPYALYNQLTIKEAKQSLGNVAYSQHIVPMCRFTSTPEVE